MGAPFALAVLVFLSVDPILPEAILIRKDVVVDNLGRGQTDLIDPIAYIGDGLYIHCHCVGYLEFAALYRELRARETRLASRRAAAAARE